MVCTGLAALLSALAVAPTADARVVVVGLDGASWNLIDPMLEAGLLPHLARLIARGSAAELRATPPINSPSLWTTIATGQSPRRHGVTDFHVTRHAIRVPTAFERMAAAGRRVGLYDYLVTWPPRTLPGGFVIPGWLRHDGSTWPDDVWQRAGVTPFTLTYEAGMGLDEILALALREPGEKAKRFCALEGAFDLDVGAVTFYALDQVAHRFYSAAFPDQFAQRDRPHEPLPPGYATAIADVLRALDQAIGVLVACLGPGDTIVAVSDHGFERHPKGVEPVWIPRTDPILETAALDPSRDHFNVVTNWGVLIVYVHSGAIDERDAVLDRILAAIDGVRTDGGERIFATDFVDLAARPKGARRSIFQRMRQWAIRVVAERVQHINTDRTGHAYVFARPRDGELRELWPGGTLLVGGVGHPVSAVFQREDYSGDHSEKGLFVAAGAGIAASRERGRLSSVDVAPLLLQLESLPIPDDLEGRLPESILDPAFLAATPPRRVAADGLPGLPADPPIAGADRSVDPDLTELLRRLGYVR